MRKPIIAGNWKMNLNHLEAIAVTQKLSYSLEERDYEAVEVVIFPPFTDIRSVQTLIDGDRLKLQYGAQDLSPEASGAFTGDISGSMLNKLGCTYVLIGHSERRTIHNEGDSLVATKIKAALANELTPILCIGEDLSIREGGTHVAHVVAQVQAALSGFHKPDLRKLSLLMNLCGPLERARLRPQRMPRKYVLQFALLLQRSQEMKLHKKHVFSMEAQ